MSSLGGLSKRERQVLDILYRRGRATAAEVHEELPKSSYSAVRGMLRVLHEKGLASYVAEGVRYVYSPTVPREQAAKSALDGLLQTFFENSLEQVVVTLLNDKEMRPDQAELERLAELIQQAKDQRR